MTTLRVTPSSAVLFAIFGCSACQVIGGYETFHDQSDTVGEMSAPICGGRETPIASPPPEKGALLVLAEGARGACFWIDKTEVTVAQYRQYLKAAPAELSWSGADAESCSWKQQRTDPENVADDCTALTGAEDRPFESNKPIRCVDWCDALAFCRWAGKSLCGAEIVNINVTTGETGMLWSAACSKRGTPYPYGDGKTLDATACNIGFTRPQCANFLHGPCGPAAVSSALNCESPGGAVDMVGNVAEWTANCGKEPPVEKQGCSVKGGSFADQAEDRDCSTQTQYEHRDARQPGLGFRCCDDLVLE